MAVGDERWAEVTNEPESASLAAQSREPGSGSAALDSYLKHRRLSEPALWIAWWMLNAAANTVVSLMDLRRGGFDTPAWEPAVWEFSSAIVALLLIPGVLVFERRFPIQLGTWRRVVPVHLLATIPYSVLHVLGMVGLRHLAYALAGGEYDFGHWPRELFYEYLKDARTYAGIIAVVYLYRSLLLRLRGEARLLTAPEAGPPVEAIDRPERFLVKKLGAEFLVPARDIEWLEAAENYVNLHVRDRVYPLRSTMAGILERLDPAQFVRVHRSYIVNLDFIEQIEPLDTGDARLLLKDGTRIPCSRRYRPALRQERVAAQT